MTDRRDGRGRLVAAAPPPAGGVAAVGPAEASAARVRTSKRLKAALTSRSTVIGLLLMLAAAMTVAAVVPQRGVAAAARPENRSAFVTAFGLDHVFSTTWFAALALFFVAALLLSTVDQFRVSRARMRQPPPESVGGGVACTAPRDRVEARLARAGYRKLSERSGRTRHVKLWHGYWGNFLLHAGMTMAVLFSVVYVLTEHRVQLHAVSGRPILLARGTYAEDRGLLARDLPLPAEVNLYKVEPVFGANDQLVDLGSQLIFTDGAGASREVRVAVNDYQDYRGLVVYQVTKFGNAFFVEVQDAGGASAEIVLEMPLPAKRGTASYVNEPLEGGRVLKAKYYASADRTRLVPENPLLVLRLYEGERLVEEASLLENQAARLGPWTVRLTRVGWWTELLFEGSLGTTGIFSGFGVLLLGAVLTFFAVPREVILRDTPEGLLAAWRTSRFPELYREEGESILAQCTGGALP